MRKLDRRASGGLNANAGVEQLRKHLLLHLRASLIPAAQSAAAQRLVLGQPPLNAAQSRAGRKQGERDGIAADIRPLRFPRFCFVLEGEADMRLGIENSTRRRAPGGIAYQVVSVTAGQILVLPTGVPQDSSAQIQRSHHWFRAEPQTAPAQLSWLIALPDGMLLHTCATRDGVHTTSAELFVKDAQLFTLTEFLIGELRTRGFQYETVARSYLVAILARTERALLQERLYLHPPDPELLDSEGNLSFAAVPISRHAYRRACDHVESHIHENLSPSTIAAAVHLSRRHLSRTFQEVAGVSVMHYVTGRRLEAAKTLLLDTHLPINEVGKIVGLPDATGFGRVFRAATGCSPSVFRKRHRA